MGERSEGAVSWLLAGQELLRSGGIGAVKLHALTKATELTTGSFYHHFKSMPDYLDELAAFYGTEQIEGSLARFDAGEPRERIRQMIASARDDKLVPLDVAMRDWAGSSTAAARAVEATDRQLLEFLAIAFEELGFDRRSSELRAHLLVSSGVARVITPWKRRAGDTEDVLTILSS